MAILQKATSSILGMADFILYDWKIALLTLIFQTGITSLVLISLRSIMFSLNKIKFRPMLIIWDMLILHMWNDSNIHEIQYVICRMFITSSCVCTWQWRDVQGNNSAHYSPDYIKIMTCMHTNMGIGYSVRPNHCRMIHDHARLNWMWLCNL